MPKAQSSLEYALLVLAVVAALIAMRIYVIRGMQGRLKQAADSFGQQYEPGKTTSDITVASGGTMITNVTSNVIGNRQVSLTNVTINQVDSRYGTENVAP